MHYDPTVEPMRVPGQTELDLDVCPPHGIPRPRTVTAGKLWSMTVEELREYLDRPIDDDDDHDLHHLAARELMGRSIGPARN